VSATERLDGFLCPLARHQPHAQEAQHPVGVEDGGAVEPFYTEVSIFSAGRARWRKLTPTILLSIRGRQARAF
jgi:hypothetical protein